VFAIYVSAHCIHNVMQPVMFPQYVDKAALNKKKGILVLIVALVIRLTLHRSHISIKHVADKNNMLIGSM